MKRTGKIFLLIILSFFFSTCQSINNSKPGLVVSPSQVIFSFDDGPNGMGDTTARLLDVLSKYEIHAMFSLLGENVEAYPDLARRIHDEGHYIVNHGYADKWAYRMKNEEFKDNLLRGEAVISAALGIELNPKLYRPHGGYYTSKQKSICLEEGYTMVGCSVRVYDAVLTEAKKDKVVRETIAKIEKQNGGIILLHDGRDSKSRMEGEIKKNGHGAFDRSWLPEAVEEIIVALLERGFILKP